MRISFFLHFLMILRVHSGLNYVPQRGEYTAISILYAALGRLRSRLQRLTTALSRRAFLLDAAENGRKGGHWTRKLLFIVTCSTGCAKKFFFQMYWVVQTYNFQNHAFYKINKMILLKQSM